MIGDLFVTYNILIPQNLTAKRKRTFYRTFENEIKRIVCQKKSYLSKRFVPIIMWNRPSLESLESYGLISISYKENQRFILKEELTELEKFSRMYYELDINIPGIDALKHLLEKIKELQQETETLRARLRIYE